MLVLALLSILAVPLITVRKDINVFLTPLQIALTFLGVSLLAIYAYVSGGSSLQKALAVFLITRYVLIASLYIRYGNNVGTAIDDNFHIWFTKSIISSGHVMRVGIYSDFPLSHILVSSYALILPSSVISIMYVIMPLMLSTVSFIISYAFLTSVFPGVALRGRPVYRSVFAAVLALPLEFFIPFLMRPRIYSTLMLLMMTYLLFAGSGRITGRRAYLLSFVFFISAMTSNISYATIYLLMLITYSAVSKLLEHWTQQLFETTHQINNLVISLGLVLIAYMLYMMVSLRNVFAPIISFITMLFSENNVNIGLSLQRTGLAMGLGEYALSVFLMFNTLLITLALALTLIAVYLIGRRIGDMRDRGERVVLFIVAASASGLGYAVLLNVSTRNLPNSLRPLYFVQIVFYITVAAIVYFINREGLSRYFRALAGIIALVLAIASVPAFVLGNYASYYVTPRYELGIIGYDGYVTLDRVPVVEKVYGYSDSRVSSMKFLKAGTSDMTNAIGLADKGSLYFVVRIISYREYRERWQDIVSALLRGGGFEEGYVRVDVAVRNYRGLCERVTAQYSFIVLSTSRFTGPYNEPLEFRSPLIYENLLDLFIRRENASLIYSNGYTWIVLARCRA